MLGSVRHPVGTSDFASYILSAQNSGADVVALANAGDDMVKALKTAEEFRTAYIEDAEDGQYAGVYHRRACARLEYDQGAGRRQRLLLGHGRKDAGMGRTLLQDHGKHADHDPRLGLLRDTRSICKAMELAKSDKAEDVLAMMHKMPIEDMYARKARPA